MTFRARSCTELKYVREKEVELIAMNKAEVEQLGLKVQFYREKLKLRFIQLLTVAVERRLQKSKERIERRLNGKEHSF